MIDIAKRKLPMPLMSVFVYISYCAASWFVMRGNLAYIGYQYNFPRWIANDAVAFFLGGLVPFLLYAFITSFVYKPLRMRVGGDVYSLRYGLNFAIIAANLVLFGLKFMYMAVPLYAPIIDIILDPAVTVGFVALYMLYAFKQNYVEKPRFKTVMVQVLGTFVFFYGMVALLGMLISVI